MNEVFTASNGVKVGAEGPFKFVKWTEDHISQWFDVSDYGEGSRLDGALAEWYQHREDERLGRVRYAESPDYVLYPRSENVVRVVDERVGYGRTLTRAEVATMSYLGEYETQARRYFEDNPVRKPWVDAEEGEVWLVSIGEYRDVPAIVQGEWFFFPTRYQYDQPDSTPLDVVDHAERIYPEPDDG